ncbi:MAG: leucyl aminopeptidase family protein [Candidatus Competibacteraceae bacterium]|uniref:Leucine aminopeptidase n=1 Tax=Candidatus Contendobacter odensis Run_B_J11 TaxID=1400861 RepID=A0A7U7GBI2_9GAMM|nr:leucyl aminopeptidase family protein [Candidatus Contendobacter odensis]MBK8536977.1 leucyl aminopeptidase family protein [Candidatus Competibacteraceae bacterium]CDH45039.1 Leucine aminopeptidase [Candidatus Contendobacter odensis Run_B_J11]
MKDSLLLHRTPGCIPLIPVVKSQFNAWLEQQDDVLRCWLTATGFKAKPGSFSLMAAADGQLRRVMVGIANADDLWALGGLSVNLPEADYFLDAAFAPCQLERLALGWALGGYQFSRYKTPQRKPARLALDPACDAERIQRQVAAITLVRDLINTPAADMMPEHLAEVMLVLGSEFGAAVEQTVGEELLARNFPLIHAVGRASLHPPRLLDLRWGDPNHPKVTLIGKGVCFDSGGLDLKPSSAMRLMKKDMGGAATVLGLARLIMSSGLPVRLRVLVAAVENAVAGNAFRPGDVIRSRQGLTIEIHNTDAEGRLVLCDALAEAATEQPAVMLDFATLTGAARVALGTELPALFCNDDELANELLAAAEREQDPFWRLPLHQPYRTLLDSKIADLANAAESSYAGAITAALFLKEFVPAGMPWAHFDLMAWNLKSQPGRPEGGEAMSLRAVFGWLEQRYGGS